MIKPKLGCSDLIWLKIYKNWKQYFKLFQVEISQMKDSLDWLYTKSIIIFTIDICFQFNIIQFAIE